MKITQITFTRFLAALAIVIFHFGREIVPFKMKELHSLVENANIGVSYFFFLSGFIMIISYDKGKPIPVVSYYKNRFARIYPVYLLGLLAYLPIRYMINLPIDVTFGAHLFMLQSWIPGWILRYNFPGWSVSVELLFYFIFPILYNIVYSKKAYLKLTFIGVILIWFISQFIFHYLLHDPFYKGEPSQSHELLFYNPILHLNEFLVGNCAGIWFLNNYQKYRGNYDVAIIVSFALIIVALKVPLNVEYHNGLFGVFIIPLIVFLSLNTGKITSLFSNPKLEFLGEISYGLYIYQLPVFYYLKSVPITQPELAFVFKTLVLLVISALSYKYIEVPMRNRIRSVKWI